MRIYAFADEASPAIDGQIAAMRRNGLNGLEIRGVDGENVSTISLEKAKEVRRKLDDAGLCTWSIGSPIGKIDIETGDFAAHLGRHFQSADIGRQQEILVFLITAAAGMLQMRIIKRHMRLRHLESGCAQRIHIDHHVRLPFVRQDFPRLRLVFAQAQVYAVKARLFHHQRRFCRADLSNTDSMSKRR